MQRLERSRKSKSNRKSRKKKNLRGSSMPLWGDSILNTILRYFLSTILFWLIYMPIYNSDTNILNRISFALLLLITSSILSYILSFFLVSLILKKSGYPRKGFTELNKNLIPEAEDLIFHFTSLIVNALFIAFGLLWIFRDISGTFTMFLVYYMGSKILGRLCAYGIGFLIKRNFMYTLLFLAIFFILIIIAAMQINEVIVFDDVI